MTSDRADIQGDELPPGSILCGGQYTIDQYLNAGGFGVTYLARDSLGRRVVIKECFPSALCFRANQTVRVRSQGNAFEFDTILELFEKEARALASLQNPYIVGVHQFFRDNDTAYMAMDFVEGRTLLDIIERDPTRLTPEVVTSMMNQLLQAVNFIHRHDILHRDISPDNILIDDDNLPVLIDFGAAREDATRVSRALSKVQTVKDGYSPQEFYLAGSDQVYASDLYALAATFHHLLTGRAPASSHSRMAAAVRDAPDPLKPLDRIDGYDVSFISAINTCLSLFPGDRLQTAEAWQETIDAELRNKRLMRLAAVDQTLDRTVAHLVKDFFKDFEPIRSGPKSKPEPSPTTAAQSQQAKRARAAILTTRQADPIPEPNSVKAQTQMTTEHLDAEQVTDDLAPQPIHPRRPNLPPQEAAPVLLPIDRIRLKYSKQAMMEAENPSVTTDSIFPSWFGRFGLTTRTNTKPRDRDDKSEETA